MHPSTYEYLKPTEEQIAKMARVRAAAKAFNGRNYTSRSQPLGEVLWSS